MRAVIDLKKGDHEPRIRRTIRGHEVGTPYSFAYKAGVLNDLRRFLCDYEEWGWGRLQFNPREALRTPRRLAKGGRRKPRPIDEDVWKRLVTASCSLSPEDAPAHSRHPFEFLQAVSVVWTHSGLRANEILRLRLDCVSLQEDDIVTDEGRVIERGSLAYLTVPPSKGAVEFVKPVARVVHDAIRKWMAVRTRQPRLLDRKTGEWANLLFTHQGRYLSNDFLRDTVIPTLCAKAGVQDHDSRGKITSHRARTTLITQLANSDHPLSLQELMQWTGHSEPQTTMYYIDVLPRRLAASYQAADEMGTMVGKLIGVEEPDEALSALDLAREARAAIDRFLGTPTLTDEDRALVMGERSALLKVIRSLDASDPSRA